MTALSPRTVEKGPVPNSLTTGQLPRFAELYIFGASAVVSGVLLMLIGFDVIGWLVLSAVVYLVLLGILSSLVENRRKAIDRLVRGLVTVAFLLAIIPLVSTLFTVVSKGIGALSYQFITQTGGSSFNPDTLEVTNTPGALQAIVGTLIITGIAALISVPIGLFTSIYLVEYGRPGQWLSRTVTFLVDVMTGIPSIVAGLFAFSLFTIILGPKAFSGFSASVALSVLMIPTVVRACEEMLRLVPHDLREASYALGVSKFATIVRIVLPTAIAGIVTGIMLAIARVIGETAPIFMAASFTDNFNSNPFEGPMQTLPVMAYTGFAFPGTDIAASNNSAWGAALLLVILVVILNLIARVVAKVFAPKGSR
ncbi:MULTISPECIES: phosphate ABC transporter permease PstA [unclassified Agreia]|uniref:phosphate ABC transporter permease PstA n=1 Tax=unclassified Agreia TaxID=2641148 RepID=UPI0006F2A225|nr:MULTISPECIES: phosphate ABC transporter permease PstA [Microbacteriaceae]KQM59059.1 phosphate ABC transporter permease [Agreia sp. Leaf210]KQR20596.1 phosphate ABC transporter permease [Agreia sp. Leaf335]PPF61673.1 phosphate ABC transporter permease PtsA [Clavibacter michiganensis]